MLLRGNVLKHPLLQHNGTSVSWAMVDTGRSIPLGANKRAQVVCRGKQDLFGPG
jgi:hypothetical protein